MAARKGSKQESKATSYAGKGTAPTSAGDSVPHVVPRMVVPGRDFERSRRIRFTALIGGILLLVLLLIWKFCGDVLSVQNGPNPEQAVQKEPEKIPKKEEKAPVVKPKPAVVKKDEPRVIRDEDFKPEPIRSQMALTYTIQKGDSLEKIAGNALGSKGRWKEIRDANRLKNVGPRDILPVNRDIMIPVQ